jgi:hypothetical protein
MSPAAKSENLLAIGDFFILDIANGRSWWYNSHIKINKEIFYEMLLLWGKRGTPKRSFGNKWRFGVRKVFGLANQRFAKAIGHARGDYGRYSPCGCRA